MRVLRFLALECAACDKYVPILGSHQMFTENTAERGRSASRPLETTLLELRDSPNAKESGRDPGGLSVGLKNT